jgi:adenylate cyclase
MEGEVERAVLDEVKLWHQTLRAYRAQQWDQVEVSLLNLQRMNPDCELYALYGERVTQFRRNPPAAGWDGVTSFDDK